MARAGRVAKLSKELLTISETPPDNEEQRRLLRWPLIPIAVGVLIALMAGSWYAGRQSSRLEAQAVNAQLNHLTEQLSARKIEPAQERARNRLVTNVEPPRTQLAASDGEARIRRQLLESQVAADQYKAIIDRERQTVADDSRIIKALSSSGAHLVSFKPSEAAAGSVAYALVIENSKLLFTASNLPAPGQNKQYQLWLLRKQEPKTVSAGVFTPNDEKRGFLEFEEASVISHIAHLEVTEEPPAGSSAPTGDKLLESSRAQD